MFTISIQAGGGSTRMGEDKAKMLFLGVPLIQRVIGRIASLADEIIVTTNSPEKYEFLEIPLFTDVYPGIGALGGLHTALMYATHPLVAVVACDLPFANPLLLAECRDILLDTNADAAIPTTEHGLEPLFAVYRRKKSLKLVEAALESGKRRMIAWHEHANIHTFSPEVINRLDPKGVAFWNLNTPESFRKAEVKALEIEGET